jgi:hypothetical protein
MNIYAPKGTKENIKRVSKDQWQYFGFNSPKGILKVGEIYTVKKTIVHGSFTIVMLEEVPDFECNSVWFDEVD